MPYRAAVQTEWAGLESDENRQVEVLIFLCFHNFRSRRFADFEIGTVGVKDELRLKKNGIADPEPDAELRTEADIVHSERKGGVAAPDENIIRAFQLRLETAFQTEGKLCMGSAGSEQKEACKRQIFHTLFKF